MAAPDETPLKNLINSNIPDATPGVVRRGTAAVIRATLFQLIDWVKTGINNNLTNFLRISDKQPGGANTDAVYRTGKAVFGRDFSNGTTAALEATTGWIDNLNGNRVSPWFTITQPGDGLGATQYYSICELAAQSGGTYDYVQVEFIGKPWSVDGSNGSPIELSLLFTNRGGFKYQYTSRGDGVGGTGIICQQMPDGRTVVYMVADNAFKAISARITSSVQAIVYQTPGYNSTLAGLGTEVFNSTKPTVYRPLLSVRSRFTAFTITNSDGGWPAAPISEAGSAQLSIGANWQAGSSEVSMVNSNLVGAGFSFWQQTGATTKRFLAYLNGVGSLLLGGRLIFQSNTANRKIALYDTNDNDHQFYGFGVDPGGLRYQIDSSGARHTWYAGDTALTSKELMRLQGNGFLGLGIAAPGFLIDAGISNPGAGIIARFTNSSNGTQAGATGAYLQLHQGGVAQWKIGIPPGVSALAFHAFDGGNQPEVARFTEDRRMFIGQTTGTDRDLLQVNGSISGKAFSQSSNPSSGDVPNGYFRLVKNTGNGEVRLWVNDGGTMKSTLLS